MALQPSNVIEIHVTFGLSICSDLISSNIDSILKRKKHSKRS